MKKKWTIKHDCRNMSTNEIIDAILEDRNVEDINALLYPNEDCLIPFEKMKNIHKAAEIILDSIENGSKFLSYWDTDDDGCSSGAIATRWLRNKGADVVTYINQGKDHGMAKTSPEVFEGIDILWIVDS